MNTSGMLRNLFGNLFRHDFEILIFAALLVLGAMCLTIAPIASESGGDGGGAGGSGGGAGGSGAGGSGGATPL